MKDKKIIWLPVCWLIYSLLIIIGLLIPGMKVQQESISMFAILSSGSLAITTSSIGVSLNDFYSLLIVFTYFVPIFLSLTNKTTCKYISLSIAITLFAFSLAYLKDFLTIKEHSSSTSTITAPGIVVFFIASLNSVFICFCDLIFNVYYDKIISAVSNGKESNDTIALLEENKKMLEKGFITQEEYDARRKKILGE